MRFDPFENPGRDSFDRYLFYRGLGYSVPASEILSRMTYGDDETVSLANHFPVRNRLQSMYDRMQAENEHPEEPDAEPEPEPVPVSELSVAEGSCGSFSCYDLADAADFGPETGGRAAGRARKLSVTAAPCIKRSTDEYEPIAEKKARGVFSSPTSTFRMTTGTASMGILFNQLRSGRGISLDQVRIEELLNAFDYASEPPTDAKFVIRTELLPKSENKKLLYINVQAREEQREHQNIVVLLDVSGSMYGNAEVTQAAVAVIVSRLQLGDTFSLVTYSDTDRTVVAGHRIRGDQDREDLMGLLLGLEIGGCTRGSAGIRTAYELGTKHYRKDWSNQVILITDGDLNFGITDKGGLRELIEDKKRSGLFLSVIGTGLWNYKDDKLELLAKHGNGTYCAVNELPDVEEFIVRRYAALTNIIAKDVKAQVEFNPRLVRRYRLLGYENRELAHEDFADDTVISEPYGSGGHGVALYELEMGPASPADLKYQTAVPTGSDELCTVKIRYKDPLADTGHELETTVRDRDHATDNTRLAWFVSCLSEKLRRSDKLDTADEAFLSDMLAHRKYKTLGGGEKLVMLAEAMMRNL